MSTSWTYILRDSCPRVCVFLDAFSNDCEIRFVEVQIDFYLQVIMWFTFGIFVVLRSFGMGVHSYNLFCSSVKVHFFLYVYMSCH